MDVFEFDPRTRLVVGPDTVDRVGQIASGFGVSRVLLATDQHIVEAGHAGRARSSLEAAGIQVELFAQVHENPTTEDVDACVEVARKAEIGAIIGLGGGSSMDTAKGCNFILTNGGQMEDYCGVGLATRPMLPMIAIPTTAGTGSETQSFALIGKPDTHMKMACGDKKAAAKVAILDPTLTVTQPRKVCSATAIDALTHAVETAVTNRRNSVSLLFSRESFRLIDRYLPVVFDHPEDLHARGQMQLAAAFAGMAIENSMLGAAHSAANPLTAHFDTTHGQAVGAMLPAVIRFNGQQDEVAELYRLLVSHAGLIDPEANAHQAVDKLIERVEFLLGLADMHYSLEELQVPREMIPTLASEAAAQWTAQFNPRAVDVDDFVHLYQSAYRTSPVSG